MGAIGDLSLPALDVLWEDLKLGGIPFPLEVGSYGDTAEERGRIKAAVYEQLEHRGLAEAGSATAELSGLLRLLAAPKISIDLVALNDLSDKQPVRAVVAARVKRAVLAVQGDLAVTVTRVRETAIVGSIVDLLPPNRSGPGQSVTLPGAVGGRHRRDAGVLQSATPQAEQVDAILDRPTIRAGSIGIMLRDDQGKIQRLPGIGFFDTDQGRYATTTKRGSDGEDWTTIAPADNARIARRLAETLVQAIQQ